MQLTVHPLAQAKVQAISENHGTRATYYSCDVTDADRLRFLFEEAMPKTRYPLRGVVTCAGVSGRVPAVDYPVDDFRRIVDINLVGTFIVAQAAAREMRNQNVSGSIVLVASMSGWGSNKVNCKPYPLDTMKRTIFKTHVSHFGTTRGSTRPRTTPRSLPSCNSAVLSPQNGAAGRDTLQSV